jgi:outer membrane protein
LAHNFYRFLFFALFIVFFAYADVGFSDEGSKPLTIEECLQLALKNSALLDAAREGVREAHARKNEAFSGFLPRLSTSYGYTRLNTPPSFNFPGIPPLIPSSTMITGTEDNYNWALEIRQPLFAGGGIVAGYEIGRIGEELARTSEATVKLETIKEVKTAYFRILKAEKMLDVAKQTVEGLRSHRDQAQIFYNLGLIPRNDVLTAEVELANGSQLLLKAQNSVELSKASLNILLRREINAPLRVEDILKYLPFDKSWDDCLKITLENRTEIKAYDLQIAQTQYIVKQAKSEYFPTVNFLANYSRFGDGPDVSGSAYKSQESWYMTLIANWNIWDGGRTKNRLEASMSREKQAVYTSLTVRDRIILELKNAYLLVKEAEKQISTSKEAVGQAEENMRITKERYREQVARATDVIDAQTILTRAQSEYFNALGDYHLNLAELDRVTGQGGFYASY